MVPQNRFDDLLAHALAPLKGKETEWYGELFRTLFLMSYDDLNKAEIGNPMEHHLIVLGHVIRIAMGTGLNVLNAGAIAILHDIVPVRKIRRSDVADKKSEREKNALEMYRRQNRRVHMVQASAKAREKLYLLNGYYDHPIFSDDDINEICEVIGHHDNPTINIPIQNEYHMGVMFREADRLWLLSSEGILCDLRRDGAVMDDGSIQDGAARARLEHILFRYRQERVLYDRNDKSFIDDEYFFRTKIGFGIFKQYYKDRVIEFGLSPSVLEMVNT